MAGSFEVLPHTADTGVAVFADSLAELFEWAAQGMFGLMYDVVQLTPQVAFPAVAEAAGGEELMVDLLSELLYRSEADEVVPCRFDVVEVGLTRVEMVIGAVAMRPELLQGPPIKAVTYHDLVVEQGAGGQWAARIVFDV